MPHSLVCACVGLFDLISCGFQNRLRAKGVFKRHTSAKSDMRVFSPMTYKPINMCFYCLLVFASKLVPFLFRVTQGSLFTCFISKILNFSILRNGVNVLYPQDLIFLPLNTFNHFLR